MKFSSLVISISAIVLFCFSSCLEITEEIRFNKNGSGEAKTVVDIGQMMGMMAMFIPDSLKESMNLEEIMAADLQAYNDIKGISNTSMEKLGEYSFAIKYKFDNPTALNKAMNLSKDQEAGLGLSSDYDWKGKKLIRSTTAESAFDSMMGETGMDPNDMGELMKMFNAPTYTVQYEFPKKAKKVKVKDTGKLSKNGNTIKLEYDLLEMMNQKGKVMNHQIKF